MKVDSSMKTRWPPSARMRWTLLCSSRVFSSNSPMRYVFRWGALLTTIAFFLTPAFRYRWAKVRGVSHLSLNLRWNRTQRHFREKGDQARSVSAESRNSSSSSFRV